MSHLNLLFPQWQGSGRTKELYYGALSIKEAFCLDSNFKEIEINDNDNIMVENDILGHKEIMEQLNDATQLVNTIAPSTIFTIGGGCDVEIAPVSYLNKKYDGNLSIIWFDAHGDLNTPTSSQSKKFHGMPLRTLLGEGNQNLIQQCFSKISASQLILIGVRDLDISEEVYINENKIVTLPVDCIEESTITELINRNKFDNVYIHIDLDVLEPKIFPSVMCPTPKGIDFDRLLNILDYINNNYNIVGLSLLEYSPIKGDNINKLKYIVDLGVNL